MGLLTLKCPTKKVLCRFKLVFRHKIATCLAENCLMVFSETQNKIIKNDFFFLWNKELIEVLKEVISLQIYVEKKSINMLNMLLLNGFFL